MSLRGSRPDTHPSSSSAGWALLPLRGFLGVTFVFAGLQKLANPGFFDANNPVSIQQQLKEAAHSSPIHAVIGPLGHVAVPLGVIMALGELAVGLGTLLGLWSRIAAAGGLVISLGLFLTISYHSSPYYTGSDIVFVFAWLPVLVAGSGGVLAVGSLRPGRATAGAGVGSGPTGERALDRRTFTRQGAAVGAVGAIGVLLAGLAAGVGRWAGHYKNFPASSSASPLSAGTTPPTTEPPGSSSPTTVPPGKAVGLASAVPVQGSATFTDPTTGDPAVVVQPQAGTFVAFDAICPHEGCTVGYSTAQQLFICPCHGSRFNGETGALVKGPATRGLTAIKIAEGPDGELYAR
jgi:thiosulfate dehydrogenase [quinone] large subunit